MLSDKNKQLNQEILIERITVFSNLIKEVRQNSFTVNGKFSDETCKYLDYLISNLNETIEQLKNIS